MFIEYSFVKQKKKKKKLLEIILIVGMPFLFPFLPLGEGITNKGDETSFKSLLLTVCHYGNTTTHTWILKSIILMQLIRWYMKYMYKITLICFSAFHS